MLMQRGVATEPKALKSETVEWYSHSLNRQDTQSTNLNFPYETTRQANWQSPICFASSLLFHVLKSQSEVSLIN
ncbi:hypothetical protein [Trichormus sp. NMC-1]|uniref:hypothetical protein n=1 Tax=Trichormus sp. NMC-1 TaxID=1853259 RepID=UPI0008DBF05A|nr:hypothetical protein [Trichormus sp. NMC-1]